MNWIFTFHYTDEVQHGRQESTRNLRFLVYEFEIYLEIWRFGEQRGGKSHDSTSGTLKQRKRALRSPSVERDKMATLSQRAGEWKLPTSWGRYWFNCEFIKLGLFAFRVHLYTDLSQSREEFCPQLRIRIGKISYCLQVKKAVIIACYEQVLINRSLWLREESPTDRRYNPMAALGR